ncbi:cilia- and flagella-associated protein 206 isoform 1-T2 [Glossina fuscipes fuscipes]
MKSSKIIARSSVELITQFINEIKQRSYEEVDKDFAKYFLLLLIRDAHDGLDLINKSEELSVCKIQNFLEKAVQKYICPLDATACSLKICYFFKRCKLLDFEYVKEQYESNRKELLNRLIGSVLQYPETCNAKQLQEMFMKMQIFIITNYSIGSPKDHVLLKKTEESLNSIIGKRDLKNYILKKKYNRLEYLQRLGAIVCGILIFNDHAFQGDPECVRDIFSDLAMAKKNAKEAIEASIDRAIKLIAKGNECFADLIVLDVHEEKVKSLWPIAKLRDTNKFVMLFESYRRYLIHLQTIFNKTQYLIEVNEKKFDCVVNKINEILKFRSAVESELIFPHFVYLSELWTTLELHLAHIAEIIKIKDHLDELVSENLERNYIENLEATIRDSKNIKYPIEPTFSELMELTNKCEGQLNLMKLKNSLKDFCSLTIALTNGLLMPACLQKKLCENSDMLFGFANIENAKYAERYFAEFLKTLKNAVFTSTDLIVLSGMDDEVLEQYVKLTHKAEPKTKTFETQTEFVIENDLSVPNQINVTWNVWDFHRETIRLANIRQRQTHSTQSNLSYGKRNAQNQAYHTRQHKGF